MNKSYIMIKNIISQIEEIRNIQKHIIIKMLKNILSNVINKKDWILDIEYNKKTGHIILYQQKKQIKQLTSKTCINLKHSLNIACKKQILGEFLKIPIEVNLLNRSIAQNARISILQKIKDIEKNILYDNYNYQKNKLITGVVKRLDKGNLIINLGSIEGIIPYKEQIHTEYIRAGDNIVAYSLNILKLSSGFKVLLSRSNKNFILKLFEQEIPEISDNTIQIYNIARIPGFKTKILVSSNKYIDVLGACIGVNGIRIKNIIKELQNEKIEIIPYHENIGKLVCNSLEPIEILQVIIKEKKHILKIILPEKYLSLAIGNYGKNIKLIMDLICWKIEVQSNIKLLYEKYYINQVFYYIKNIYTTHINSFYNNNIKKMEDIMLFNDKHMFLIFGVKGIALSSLKKQINYLIFMEKIYDNKNLIHQKKEIFNLFIVYANKNIYNSLMFNNCINISSTIKNNLINIGYNIFSFYLERSYFLSLLIKIHIDSIHLLKSIIIDYIYILFNKQIFYI